jgi:hypothetical protein
MTFECVVIFSVSCFPLKCRVSIPKPINNKGAFFVRHAISNLLTYDCKRGRLCYSEYVTSMPAKEQSPRISSSWPLVPPTASIRSIKPFSQKCSMIRREERWRPWVRFIQKNLRRDTQESPRRDAMQRNDLRHSNVHHIVKQRLF